MNMRKVMIRRAISKRKNTRHIARTYRYGVSRKARWYKYGISRKVCWYKHMTVYANGRDAKL